MDVTKIENEIEESQEILEKVMECKRKIDLKLKQRSSESNGNQTESSENTGQGESSTSQAKMKLPKLTLLKFRGDVTKWKSFWDSFRSAIHDNQDISEVDKFNYLNSVLEGSVVRAIAGLSLTNYEHAVQILQDRFGKTQQIITAHMDELIKITQYQNDRPSSLRYVYDQISVHTRGLAFLGVSSDQYRSLLIPITMNKLPSEIRLQVARNSRR